MSDRTDDGWDYQDDAGDLEVDAVTRFLGTIVLIAASAAGLVCWLLM